MKNRFKAVLGAIILLITTIWAVPQNAEAKELPDMYTVIVLNNSGNFDFLVDGKVIYTAETATKQVKKGAKTFLNVLEKAENVTGGNVHVAIITYDRVINPVTAKSYVKLLKNPKSAFTTDLEDAKNKVEKVKVNKYLDGGNNMSLALEAANILLDSAPEDAVKNTVIFSNGMASAGTYLKTGHYDSHSIGGDWVRISTGVPLYQYANAAYKSATKLKKQGKVYSLGFYDSFAGMPDEGKDVRSFFQLTAKDIASKNRYISVTSAKKISTKFKSVANKIVNEWKNS